MNLSLNKIREWKAKHKKTPLKPECAAVILAAGSSVRMGSDKILARLGELPVLARTLRPFQECSCVKEIVVVTAADKLEEVTELCREYNIGKVTKVLCGGKTRTESALTGVSEVSGRIPLIAIHDGARPLVTEELIRRCIEAAAEKLAVVPAIRSTDTLKTADEDGLIVGNVSRETTWRMQTPQVFQSELIKGALSRAMKQNLPLTDDSSAMELIGVKTWLIEGDEENIKLTKPLDLMLAEAILRDRRKRDADRTGL